MLVGGITAPNCSKDKLWNALADAVNDVSMDTTEKFTSSADNRLLLVSQNEGGYTNHLSQSKRKKILF